MTDFSNSGSEFDFRHQLFEFSDSPILHIGLPKTGSSSLQTALTDCREILPRHGVVYPKTSIYFGPKPKHTELRLVMSGIDPKQTNMPEDWLKRFQEETAEADICVVSCEGFSTEKKPEVFTSYFPRNRTRVVMYVREPVEHVVSFYKHRVRIKNMTLGLRDFARSFRLPYLKVADRWSAAYGTENVLIRQIDHGDSPSDIVSDFMGLIGQNLTASVPRQEYELNQGIAGNLLFIKRILNLFITFEDCRTNPQGNHYSLGREMRELTKLDRSFCGKIPVDQETVDIIADLSKEDLEGIERRFGLTLRIRDKPVEAPPCPDHDNIPQDFARILAKAREGNFVMVPILERISGIFASILTD